MQSVVSFMFAPKNIRLASKFDNSAGIRLSRKKFGGGAMLVKFGAAAGGSRVLFLLN